MIKMKTEEQSILKEIEFLRVQQDMEEQFKDALIVLKRNGVNYIVYHDGVRENVGNKILECKEYVDDLSKQIKEKLNKFSSVKDIYKKV